MCRTRIVVLALALFACQHHETPTSPTSRGCGPVMGALGDVDVTGHVTTADGRPSDGATVRFIDDAGYAWSTSTDAAGKYLSSGAFNHGWYTLYVIPAGESHPVANWRLELACGDNVRDVVIPSTQCTYVTGLVTAKYTRVANARVSFAGESVATSSWNGAYVLNLGCPPPHAGIVSTFSVTHPDYQPYSLSLPIPDASTTIDVKLVPR